MSREEAVEEVERRPNRSSISNLSRAESSLGEWLTLSHARTSVGFELVNSRLSEGAMLYSCLEA